jgi:hypothetical protein
MTPTQDGTKITKKKRRMPTMVIEAETLPMPLHIQQQSTNSTYTSKRVKGRTGRSKSQ